MKLISSKKTKRRIALSFIFAFVLSNLLTLFGPSAKAVPTFAVTAGTCFQHTGAVSNGALVTVYNIGSITVSLTASEISPAEEAQGAVAGTNANIATTAGAATAQATLAGKIDAASDTIGNIFSFVPPTGTNFVIVPGFQSLVNGSSNLLATTNASISNAVSVDGSAANAQDGTLGISVGVVTNGTVGLGRAIVAIAKDTATTGNGGTESYPKANTGNNSASIVINGLGLAIPPSEDQAYSGTLQATVDGPPSGLLASGGNGAYTVLNALTSLPSNTTINLCTVTSPLGRVEAVSDLDNDSGELYDKTGAASQNLIALGQIGTATTISVLDTTSGVTAPVSLDLEPILLRGTGTTLTGVGANDQVFTTGSLVSDIDTTAENPATTGLSTGSSTFFGQNPGAPITIVFSDGGSSATTTLTAVDLIIEQSSAAAAPTTGGFSATQGSRFGFLGALRAALHEGGNTASYTDNIFGSTWGIAAIGGGGTGFTVQETVQPITATMALGALGGIAANAVEPFNATFLDLRINCNATTPVAGWFAVGNSGVVANTFGTVPAGTLQLIKRSFAGTKYTGGTTNVYQQTLTNISGTTPAAASRFIYGDRTVAAGLDTVNGSNALLYASCSQSGDNGVLTILPIQNGFDNARDIIAITPAFTVTNISNTFASDVNIVAQISGNNLSGNTTLTLGRLIGVPATGGTSTLASVQGIAVAENDQVGVDCSSGGIANVTLSTVTTGSVATKAASACSGGTIAQPGPFFTGGAPNSVSGTTVIDGSPTVQSDSRGILLTESTTTGFNELLNQIGGGFGGVVFEVSLPAGCDVIDDQNDGNTAVSAAAATAGNDVTRISFTNANTGGIAAAAAVGTAGGVGDAAITNANQIQPASGATPAKILFRFGAATGSAADAAATDSVLFRIDSQDLFCPITVTGPLTATVNAQNKVTSPTLIAMLGTASLGTATQAFSFEFADDVATSTKGETSTNTMIGATPRLSTGGVTTAHPFKITELNSRSIPIGGRVSAHNFEPDGNILTSVLTRGQIWLVPASGAAFSAAPAAADVSFSDDSLIVDGTPALVTSATIDANAPLGTVIIGVKDNPASTAANPATSTTKITVRNLKFAASSSSTTDLVASIQFFSQDGSVVVNTPGVAAGNSGATPTIFTPFAPGSAKGGTQINAVVASVFQLGSGSLANSLLTSRLTTEGTPQLNPFAKVVTSAKNADATKITVSAAAVPVGSSSGSATTDNVVTVTGAVGAVDGGAEVVVTTGSSSTFDSVTVVSADDGSFVANLRGDCAAPATSVTVTAAQQVSGTKTASVTKTALCNGSTGETTDSVFNDIAGADGTVSITEVLSYVTAQGGLSAIVTAGGAKLSGVIKAAKSALGLS